MIMQALGVHEVLIACEPLFAPETGCQYVFARVRSRDVCAQDVQDDCELSETGIVTQQRRIDRDRRASPSERGPTFLDAWRLSLIWITWG